MDEQERLTAEAIEFANKMKKIKKAEALRYKKAALDSMSFEDIRAELNEIAEVCSDVQYTLESEMEEKLLVALDGDEEEFFEFKMAFADLDAMCERFSEQLYETESTTFDDTLVALVGRKMNLVGYDGYQEDYFSLGEFQQEYATQESGKRIMRMTKSEMIAEIGKNLGILMGYLDLRQRYDYLKCSMDILLDESLSMQLAIEEIEKLHQEAELEDFSPHSAATRKFDQMVKLLPERMWVE